MNQDKEFERLFRQEFKDLSNNIIFQTETGDYEVFSKYRIISERPGYRVYCSETEIGIFNSTKTALSWCIADKFSAYNTAREILETDAKLTALAHDISARANIADRSKNNDFRDTIGTKLESKIIKKKHLENQLAKCVNWAKYIQQRGFNNETNRTGRNQTSKTSR